jgi:hypothetical protein
VNTPIQAVSATSDRNTALTWYSALHNEHGIEGIVAKRTISPYRAGRTSAWLKIRHADTIEAAVVGFTGTARHLKALTVRLPVGRVVLSRRLTTALAVVVARAWSPSPGARSRRPATPARLRGAMSWWRSWRARPGTRWSPWSVCTDLQQGFGRCRGRADGLAQVQVAAQPYAGLVDVPRRPLRRRRRRRRSASSCWTASAVAS